MWHHLAAVFLLDAHRTGTDAGDQRGVAGIDAELAGFTGQRDELGLAGEDRLLRADHVHMNGVCHERSFRLKKVE